MKIKRLDEKQKEAITKNYPNAKLAILEIPVDDKENEFIEVAAQVPSRQVLSQYMKWIDQNPKKAQEILVRGCVLTDREVIEADDFMFNTTVSLLSELIPIGNGRIKKF